MSAALEPDHADHTGIRPFPQAIHIPLALIDPNPDQPRRALDGIEELAQHVKQYGVLQPVVVAPAAEGRYTLIAGHRRLAAHHWLAAHDTYPDRWRDIPAIVRTVETAERLALALAENVSRHNLPDADLATAIQLLVDLHGWSQSEIARRLGVTPQWVGQYVRVLADAELAPLVQAGQLSVALANQVRLAHTAEARQAALRAALHGAPLRIVRRHAEALGSSDAPVDPVPCESDFQPARPADAHASPEESGPRVEVRSLATAALLQRARRAHQSTVAAPLLRTTLERDLHALAASVPVAG